jgi:SAM-dependent methyltransferase
MPPKNKPMKMVKRSCVICGRGKSYRVYAEANFDLKKLDEFAFSSRKIPEYMHYRLLVCDGCGLLYANPALAARKIATAYDEAAFESTQEAHYAARTYGRFLPNILRKIPDQRGALDIGTGDGAFLEELVKKGFTGVRGAEPSRTPILAAKKEIKPLIRHGLFSAKNFKKNSLSLVTCFQTLEHVYDPSQTCREAYQILKEGGAFFAVCHNRLSLSNRLLGKKSPIFDIEHLQLFSPESAKCLFEKAGFTEVEVRTVLNSYPIHYWVKLFPFPTPFKSALIKFLKVFGIGNLPFFLPAGNMAIIGYKRRRP